MIGLVVLIHLLGGAALVHAALAPALAQGAVGTLIVVLVALVGVKLAVVLAARRWLRRR